MKEKILITGACGQIGSELFEALKEKHGIDNVLATDIRENCNLEGQYLKLDVMDTDKLESVIHKNEITTVYHLAAMLSATAEKFPLKSWDLNVKTLINFLDFAKEGRIKKLFWPSSIAVFGPDAPKVKTPQNAAQNPTTLYGIAKSAGEKWCEYYAKNHNVDVRSIRYPGLISWKTAPGGGTTDYAIEIFRDAAKGKSYTCFLSKDTALPMLAMEDAIKGTLDLMNVNSSKIKTRSSYNINGLSFTPEDLFLEIKKSFPNFTIHYKPDFRQNIAESWPNSLEDNSARDDWNWSNTKKLEEISAEMIINIGG